MSMNLSRGPRRGEVPLSSRCTTLRVYGHASGSVRSREAVARAKAWEMVTFPAYSGCARARRHALEEQPRREAPKLPGLAEVNVDTDPMALGDAEDGVKMGNRVAV